MTAREFLVPDLGEGLDEADIAAWLAKEGERVELNQPLVEVETAKATVEIPSPYAGVVKEIHAAVGETVKVGTPLVTFEVAEAPSASGAAVVPASTPAVRAVARKLGIDLSTVAGTGPGGRIMSEDINRGAQRELAGSLDADVVPVTRIRRAIANNLTTSVQQIPHVTTFRTVDCSVLEAHRRELGVGSLPVLVRCLAEVCTEHRMLNAAFHSDVDEIWMYRRCNVGIATDTERGLLVPVLHDAAERGIVEIAGEIERLATAARNGSIRSGDLSGGTITISNTGSYGSEFGTPIIRVGEGAILALGAIEPRALVVDEEVVARPACTLSLSFDHRLLDGATAGRALGDLVEILESHERLEALPR